jgi:hypothetical protein
MLEPTPELLDEVRRVCVELEEITPALQALFDRARDALTALDFVLMADEPSAELEAAFDEATGMSRLYGLVWRIHEATDDYAMRTEEWHDARELEMYAACISCHGTTEPCVIADTCGKRR